MTLPRDANRVPVMKAVLNTDGVTVVNIAVNPTNHSLKISNGTTGTDFGRLPAVRDDDRVSVLMGVSSVDGVTPVEIYCDSSGSLLINNL